MRLIGNQLSILGDPQRLKQPVLNCAVLCQNPAPHAPLQFFATPHDEFATGMYAVHKYVDGLPVFAFLSKHDVERAEAI